MWLGINSSKKPYLPRRYTWLLNRPFPHPEAPTAPQSILQTTGGAERVESQTPGFYSGSVTNRGLTLDMLLSYSEPQMPPAQMRKLRRPSGPRRRQDSPDSMT